MQSHYRDPHARIDAVDLACALGAVRRLEGRLWKRSSQFPKYQERQVWVDDLQLKYSVRSGDPKTIDLAQIDQIVIHSEDRREFALCTRNGRSYTFRRKRQQASEALDSARAKAGTVLNFIPAFSYFSTEAITCIVISRGPRAEVDLDHMCIPAGILVQSPLPLGVGHHSIQRHIHNAQHVLVHALVATLREKRLKFSV